jgi:hypothetical protein
MVASQGGGRQRNSASMEQEKTRHLGGLAIQLMLLPEQTVICWLHVHETVTTSTLSGHSIDSEASS